MSSSLSLSLKTVVSNKPWEVSTAWVHSDVHETVSAENTNAIAKSMAGCTIRIAEYAPYVTAPTGWLEILESRIRDSIDPNGRLDDRSAEWISEDSANAAIAFFRLGADLFPAEPHIYATSQGDLVAEFETALCNLTTIVSDRSTILFGVPSTDPHNPIESVIRRGSNQFRDELRSFINQLTLGRHGKMAASS